MDFSLHRLYYTVNSLFGINFEIKENIFFRGYLNTKRLLKYAQRIDNVYLVEQLNPWFTCTQKVDANWYPSKENESTVSDNKKW